MKKATKAFLAGILCIGLSACGSSGSSAKGDDKKEETAAETEGEAAKEETAKEEAPKEEVKKEAAWEVGEAKSVTWTDSIGSKWIQIVCPVTNTGTKNLYLSAGSMDLEDSDGHLVDSKNLVSVFPDVLQPGETAYYYEETILDEGAPDELSILPHVKVKEATIECIRYETSDISITDDTYGGVKVTGRVENTTSEDGKMVYIVAFLYDADNNMIGSNFTILTDDLVAGDKVGFSMSGFSLPDGVTADVVDHYEIYAYPTQYQF